MTSRGITLEVTYPTLAHTVKRLPGLLLYPAIALILGTPIVAQAVMGEDPANRGLVLAPAKGEVLLACTLGGACQTNGQFFRKLAAGQINNGGTIETGITIPATPPGTGGIGFGSLLSTEVLQSEGPSLLTDTFCWAGVVSPDTEKRECVRLELGSGDSVGDIIDANPDSASECNAAAALFGQPNGTFDYLVRFDEDHYGEANAVHVVTCTGVKATALESADIAQTEVNVTANRGMAAYDLKLFGGLYCCK